MKYAILSDIHGNFEALTAVMGEARKRKAEKFVCLGDLVGYGASPAICVDIVRNSKAHCISGNHDRYVTGVTPMDPAIREVTQATIEYAKKMLTAPQIEYLNGLPLQIMTEDGMLFVHGSPRNEDEYLLSWEAIQENILYLKMNMPDVHLCFFGHTHIPMMATGTRIEARFEEKTDMAVFQLADSKTYLINPGSVGQPRDRCSKAAWAMYDSTEDVVEFHRVKYNIGGAQQRMTAAGFDPRLVMRLELAK
ncbi:MAG: metallophosphoesterase family protein [Planctomycetes bacterium]|nr:metallophosphoesterase family protein [Planctomycetota bacterium]